MQVYQNRWKILKPLEKKIKHNILYSNDRYLFTNRLSHYFTALKIRAITVRQFLSRYFKHLIHQYFADARASHRYKVPT